mgnify:CR=1 FL=1
MKKLIQKWNSINLIKRIICGLIVGIILGLAIPQASVISILGDLFVGALRGIAPLLVFFLVMSSLCHMGKGQKTNMKFVVVLYLLGNILSALAAVISSRLFPIMLTFSESTNTSDVTPPSGVAEVLKNLLMNIVSNPVDALVNANYIGILAWAIIFGIALKAASETTKTVIENISDATSTAVRWIISLAPFGIMGLIFTTISEQGLSVLLSYGRLICVLVGTMLFVALVINPIITFICTRQNPYPLVLRCLKDSGITAFFTRSSAANIPVNMELCKDLGLDEDTYSISIPLGATINMDGTSIMQGVAVVFAAQAFGIHLSPMDYVTVIGTATLASVGTAGVPSVGLVTLTMVFNSVGLPVEAIGLIMGIDRILDMTRTAVNITGDAVCTTIVAHQNGALDKSVFNETD